MLRVGLQHKKRVLYVVLYRYLALSSEKYQNYIADSFLKHVELLTNVLCSTGYNKSFQTFASCCSVLRSVWSTTASSQCVSWWARALAGRVISRAAAARRPTDMEHTRAAIAALTALDELVSAGPEHAREFLFTFYFTVFT